MNKTNFAKYKAKMKFITSEVTYFENDHNKINHLNRDSEVSLGINHR